MTYVEQCNMCKGVGTTQHSTGGRRVAFNLYKNCTTTCKTCKGYGYIPVGSKKKNIKRVRI